MSAREFFWKHDFGVKTLLISIALLLLANVIVLNRAVLTQAQDSIESTRNKITEQLLQPPPQPATYECDEKCQKAIEELVAQVIATLSGTRPAAAPVRTVRSPGATFISLGSGGSTTSQDWVRVSDSEVSFDLRDYPSGAQAFWEGNLKSGSQHSRCFARLYDKTNLRAVDFSEQSTNKTENEYLTTQPLSIWAGKNKYQLEMKSLNGVTCSLDSPKLVIKY